ncbi:MAG: hypothetical protein DRI77_00910 [Chloroflexi bacterium]|nr:MAG: hypothetical protein DRI77_00910 [Chloroflexota bacterium]
MQIKILVTITTALTMLMTGCKGASQPVATATTKPLPTQAATATLAPTSTPAPTETPPPTDTSTPKPTPTPADTSTPTLAPTPEPTESALSTDVIAINTITAAQVGQETTVEGTVVGTSSFSAGFKFTLDDGTGQIALLLWHNVYDNCWDAAEINLGATVRATGEIGQYEGQLQIEPDFGGDVKAITGASASAPLREIGSLSGGDEGQRVMIEGDIIRVEGRGDWAKLFVGDGSGEVMVFIYQNVLDRIPNNTALGTPGSRVRVVGTIETYQGNLEVIPTLPYDVVVLE